MLCVKKSICYNTHQYTPYLVQEVHYKVHNTMVAKASDELPLIGVCTGMFNVDHDDKPRSGLSVIRKHNQQPTNQKIITQVLLVTVHVPGI